MHASADAALFTDPELDDIAGGRHGNLFSALGAQPMDGGWRLAAFVPGARSVRAVGLDGTEIAALAPQGRDVFAALLAERPEAWRFEAGRGGDAWVEEDPYRFGPILGAQDEHYISEGTHGRLWDVLGAHPCEHEGAPGVRFAVWAPGARRVSVVGDFTRRDGRRAALRSCGRCRGGTGRTRSGWRSGRRATGWTRRSPSTRRICRPGARRRAAAG